MNAKFELHFEGPRVDSGALDVQIIAPALLGLSDLIGRSNSLLNGEKIRTSVKIDAFKPGSFGIDLDVSATFIQTFLFAASLANGPVTPAQILEYLGLIGNLDSFFDLLKRLAGGPVDPDKLPNQNNSLTIKGNNNRVEFNPIFILASDPDARKSAQALLSPLLSDGIEKLTVIPPAGQQRRQFVRSDVQAMFPRTDSEHIEKSSQKIRLLIEGIHFAARRRWSFWIPGGFSFGAIVKDEEFLHRLERREIVVGNGDSLEAELETIEKVSPDSVSTTYIVRKVYNYFPAATQEFLPISPSKQPVVIEE